MLLILPFLLISIAVSSIISIPTATQRNSLARKGRYQDRLYYSPHMQQKNCQQENNVIPLDLLSHKKEGVIVVVPPDYAQENNDEHTKLCHNSEEIKPKDQNSKTSLGNLEDGGYQFIKNGNFQIDRLPQIRFNQTFATNWIFNQSYIVQGSRLFPRWETQVALIGIQCLIQLENSPQNRPYSIIQQSFTLNVPTKIVLGFNFGLVTLQNAFQRMPIEKTRLLWVHFNGQLVFSSQVTQMISSASLIVSGKIGKNILTFKSIRADFDCDGSQMIALDNIVGSKI